MSKISATNSFNSFQLNPTGKKDKVDYPYHFDPIKAKKEALKDSRLLPNTIGTKWEIAKHKCLNVLSVYPAKGFAGDKNSNFYEFLTMGMFPYVTGSLTFIALFNGATKYFSPKCAQAAKKYGFGMALGVIFYAAAKEIAKKMISKPVAMKTGIDMDMPYRKVVNLIPSNLAEAAAEQKRQKALEDACMEDMKAFEYHKAFESVDFPRTDLLYRKKPGSNRNEYFDKIAEKNGFGTNLKDSDQEVKPFIKEVVTKARTAQNISQYLWAAVGVGLGVQEPWTKLLDIPKRKYSGLSIGQQIATYASKTKEAFKESCKSFFNGGLDGAINKKARYVGRAILGLAALSTIYGIYNAVRNPYMNNDKKMNNSQIFTNTSKVKED